jgi:hypothetical protein
VRRTIDSVFDAIILPKDEKDKGLLKWAPERKSRILTIISTTVKELQKIKGIKGKIQYKFDNQKTTMWIKIEG